MRAYVIRRLLTGVLILFILSVVVFLLLRIAPGDIGDIRCGIGAPPACRTAVRKELGLDKSYPVQYSNWVHDLVTGELGVSYFNKQPVREALQQRLPVTVELLIITVLMTVAIGIPFGVISAVWRNSLADYLARVSAVLGLSVPNFWVATMVLLIPLVFWGYAPPLGTTVHFFDDPAGNLKQFLPPAAVLSLASAAGIMRLTRSSLLEVMQTDYIRTARAKGLGETSVIARHALKNSVIPVVTVLGLLISSLLGGTVIIEQIFVLPGLGQYELQALFARDYPVVQSLTMYVGVVVVLMNLLVDISYGWLDPRIRYS
jgi:peptide/nickel transport system permease protein